MKNSFKPERRNRKIIDAGRADQHPGPRAGIRRIRRDDPQGPLYLQKSGIAKRAMAARSSVRNGTSRVSGRNPSSTKRRRPGSRAGRLTSFATATSLYWIPAARWPRLPGCCLTKTPYRLYQFPVCRADAFPADSRVYLLGGAVQPTSNASTGHWALQALGEIRANTAFLGTSGFYGRSGPCVENFGESEVKRQ